MQVDGEEMRARMKPTTVTEDATRWYREPLVILLALILAVTVAAVVALIMVNRSRPAVSEPFTGVRGSSRAASDPYRALLDPFRAGGDPHLAPREPSGAPHEPSHPVSDPSMAAVRLAAVDTESFQVPWTMTLRPEEGVDGDEYTFSGTMPAPEGISPDQEITMLVTYTEDPERMQEWLDEIGTVRPPAGMRVASEVQYFVIDASGEEWGVQGDPAGPAPDIVKLHRDHLACLTRTHNAVVPVRGQMCGAYSEESAQQSIARGR